MPEQPHTDTRFLRAVKQNRSTRHLFPNTREEGELPGLGDTPNRFSAEAKPREWTVGGLALDDLNVKQTDGNSPPI